ncbi:MAG: hypothetical protein ACKOC5_12050 [Chloroflexota bacterium]
MQSNDLIPLTIPVPPRDILCPALGYTAAGARYLALYWEPAGEEAVANDGCYSGDCNWEAFQAYVHHPTVEYFLSGFELGLSDDVAEHWLLLDLDQAQAWAGRPNLVLKFLCERYPWGQERAATQPTAGQKRWTTMPSMRWVTSAWNSARKPWKP